MQTPEKVATQGTLKIGRCKDPSFIEIDVCDPLWDNEEEAFNWSMMWNIRRMIMKGKNVCIHEGEFPLDREMERLDDGMGYFDGSSLEVNDHTVDLLMSMYVLLDEASSIACRVYKGLQNERKVIRIKEEHAERKRRKTSSDPISNVIFQFNAVDINERHPNAPDVPEAWDPKDGRRSRKRLFFDD